MSGKRSSRQKKKAEQRAENSEAKRKSRASVPWAGTRPRDLFAEEQQRVSELIVSCWIDLLEERLSQDGAELSELPGALERDIEIEELPSGEWAKDEVLDQLRETCSARPKPHWNKFAFVFARHELPRQRPVS
jgi:hypothetical protein